jgi:hypothetical protein
MLRMQLLCDLFFLSRVRPLACSHSEFNLNLLILQTNVWAPWSRDPPSQGLYQHRTIQQKKGDMQYKQYKTVHALGRAATRLAFVE